MGFDSVHHICPYKEDSDCKAVPSVSSCAELTCKVSAAVGYRSASSARLLTILSWEMLLILSRGTRGLGWGYRSFGELDNQQQPAAPLKKRKKFPNRHHHS